MRKLNYSFSVLAFIVVGAAGLTFFGHVFASTDAELAGRVMSQCKRVEDYADRTLCYEKNIPAFMDEGITMEQAFRVVKVVLKEDPGYQSCHVVAHLITSKEVAKDLEKWKDVLARSPTDICGTGAYHGAFQERFREESLPDASTEELHAILDGACEPREGWNPMLLDQSSCMHGMGHLLLYITNADVKKAVEACEVLANLPQHDFRRTCIEGVFMQLYQPLELEDQELIHEIEDYVRQNSEEFCNTFAGLPRYLCIKESWPVVPNAATDPAVYEALCKRIPVREEANYCASAMIYPVIEILEYDFDRILDFCRGVKDLEFRSMCYGRTASKIVWANLENWEHALSICANAPSESQDACWRELASYTTQAIPPLSEERRHICTGMPEQWKSVCEER